MHTAINTWPPIPSFIYSAMSEACPSPSLCTSAFILQPVPHLGFTKETGHHNKLYYHPAHREFIRRPLALPLFLLYSALLYLFCALFYLSLPGRFHSPSLCLCTYLLLMSRFHDSVMQRGYSRTCGVRV